MSVAGFAVGVGSDKGNEGQHDQNNLTKLKSKL